MQLLGALYNWTDDLPVCELSGVGLLTNQDYSFGDDIVSINEYEDRSFNFQCPDECYLYGIIDGHNGSKVCSFTAQKLPAELLLGQLKDDFNDMDVKAQLNEAFTCLSKAYLEDLINDSLVEKMSLEDNLLGLDREIAKHQYPTMFADMERLDKEISCGCSVVIALIHKSKLFIANVGDSRALLCRSSSNGELGLIQLSTDHTISTVSELQRLANLGIDIENLQYFGTVERTRSIGDWASKGGYRGHELLCSAKTEPILSTPSIHGGEKVDSSMQFFVLMSKGVYKAYADATGAKPDVVNNAIVTMVNEEIKKQKSPADVAQSVINQISSLHYDEFVKSKKVKCRKREDMTLLVRIFNTEGDCFQRKSNSTLSRSRLSKKSRKLAPLKMPDSKDNAETSAAVTATVNVPPATTAALATSGNAIIKPPEEVATTAKEEIAIKAVAAEATSVTTLSGNSTPVTTPVSTPGSGGSSPQFSHPFNYQYRSPSPLTTTVVKNPKYQPLHIEVDEKPEATDLLKQPILAISQEIPQRDMKPQDPLQKELPYVLNKSGLYQPLEKDGYTTRGISENSEPSKGTADPLLIITDRECEYTNTYDSESSDSVNRGEDKTILFNRPPEPLETDEEGKIKPYVDFAEFSKRINEMGGEEKVFGELMSILE